MNVSLRSLWARLLLLVVLVLALWAPAYAQQCTIDDCAECIAYAMNLCNGNGDAWCYETSTTCGCQWSCQ
jgi:hypothetical protein